MRTPCCKDAFLLALQLGWFDLGLLVVIIVKPNMKDEDEPNIPVVFKTV